MGGDEGLGVTGLELWNTSDGAGVGELVAGGDVGLVVGAMDVSVRAGILVGGDESAVMIGITGVGTGVTSADVGTGVGSDVLWDCGSSGSSSVTSGPASVSGLEPLPVPVLANVCGATPAYCSQ